MTRYETILIIRPDLEEAARIKIWDKFKSIIKKGKGEVHHFEDLGKYRLAYEVKKQIKGVYTYIGFEASGDLLRELERNIRLTEAVIKFQTFRIEGDFDPHLVHPGSDKNPKSSWDESSERREHKMESQSGKLAGDFAVPEIPPQADLAS